MNVFFSLVKRNVKLYFKDKVTFFTSLITPFILLILFVLFLNNVYKDMVDSILSQASITTTNSIKNSIVASWFIASILSTSSITVSFCSATLMVNDKINKSAQDIDVAPVSKKVVFLAYFCSTFISTMIVMGCILVIGFVFIAIVGWYLSFVSILKIIGAVILLTLFGSALACIIFTFIKSSGGMSAIATLISSCYGFLSGAYTPLSQYPKTVANLLGFNPGLYGNCILKSSFMLDPINAISNLPKEIKNAFETNFDLSYSFFNNHVSTELCYIILSIVVVALLSIFITIVFSKNNKSVH